MVKGKNIQWRKDNFFNKDSGLSTSLLLKIGISKSNTFLPVRNKYFCNMKICALGFNKLLESVFCLLLIVEAFSLQKVIKILEEVVVGWQMVR